MNSKENGLTVGELTIGIAVLIIAGLIWTTFNKEKNSEQSNLSREVLELTHHS